MAFTKVKERCTCFSVNDVEQSFFSLFCVLTHGIDDCYVLSLTWWLQLYIVRCNTFLHGPLSSLTWFCGNISRFPSLFWLSVKCKILKMFLICSYQVTRLDKCSRVCNVFQKWNLVSSFGCVLCCLVWRSNYIYVRAPYFMFNLPFMEEDTVKRNP